MKIKEPFSSQKPEPVKIRLSTPFVVRAKCKFCGEGPKYYWYIRNTTMWYDPRREVWQFDLYKKLWPKFNTDHYLSDEPKYFVKIGNFSHWQHHSYRPRLHRSRGTNPVYDRIEYLSCECSKANWAFNQKAGDLRPERRNRRSRYSYPHKFIG